MKTVSIKWSTEDVWAVRPGLTEQQADEVLDEVVRNHDASIGANWDVIGIVADSIFPS